MEIWYGSTSRPAVCAVYYLKDKHGFHLKGMTKICHSVRTLGLIVTELG